MPAGEPRWTRGCQAAAPVLLMLSTLALATAFGFQKIRSFDYWWHLSAGAWIAENGRVPRVDPFTYTASGRPWVDIHWLFQLGLQSIHRLGGAPAVVGAKVACAWALAALVASFGWRARRPAIVGFGLLLLLLVAGDRFMPRPELPSFVLLASVLVLLERHDRRPDAWLFAVLPLQVLWVNVHGLFALGIAACAIYVAAELLRPLLSPGQGLRRASALRLAAVTGLAALASLLNPNGVAGALYPLQQLSMIGPEADRGFFGSTIAELAPPLSGAFGAEPLALLLAASLAAAAFAAMVLNWRRVCGAHPLLWVAFGYLGLGAVRNLAVFAIVCAAILIRNLNEFLDRHPSPRRLRRAGAAAVLVALVLAAVDVGRGRFFERIGSLREPGVGVSQIYYPAGAVAWIARERPPGPIFHHMADGGYLTWKLQPDYSALVDGRLEMFGPELFASLQAYGPERFRALDREHHFGAVLIHYSLIAPEPLVRWLQLSSNWRLVFADETALLYLRVPGRDRLHWAELDVDAENLFAPLALPAGAVDRARRAARTTFYGLMRRPLRALDEWQALLERYPSQPQGARTHAALLVGAGRLAAAEAILRRLLREAPADASLLVQLGDLRLRGGDTAAARDLYDRSLAAQPRYAYAVLRRAALAEANGDVAHAGMLYAQALAMSPPGHGHAAVAAEGLERLAAR